MKTVLREYARVQITELRMYQGGSRPVQPANDDCFGTDDMLRN